MIVKKKILIVFLLSLHRSVCSSVCPPVHPFISETNSPDSLKYSVPKTFLCPIKTLHSSKKGPYICIRLKETNNFWGFLFMGQGHVLLGHPIYQNLHNGIRWRIRPCLSTIWSLVDNVESLNTWEDFHMIKKQVCWKWKIEIKYWYWIFRCIHASL